MTTMVKKENVQRKWYVLDAAGKPLGRTAVTAARLLRGKHKVDFTPNVDCGDFVIIVNVDKAILTGRKLDQKTYYHHTGWIGNLKEVKYNKLMAERPEFAMELAEQLLHCASPPKSNLHFKNTRAFKSIRENSEALPAFS